MIFQTVILVMNSTSVAGVLIG